MPTLQITKNANLDIVNPNFLNSNYTQIVDKTFRMIAPYINHTPLIRSEYYSDKHGRNIYLKLENLQITGAFKVRGALAKILSVAPLEVNTKFVTASSGNHGMGVAYAAKILGMQADIFLPCNTPEFKLSQIKRYGGNIIQVGRDWDDAHHAATEYSFQHTACFIHPFSDENVIAGQATIAKEIIAELPQTDSIICSIGGGGLISGIACYAKSFRPDIAIFGVETEGAASMAHSLKHGRVMPLENIASIANSIAVRSVSEITLQYVQQLVRHITVVSDQSSLNAQKELLQYEKIFAESAMTCCLAALEKDFDKSIYGNNIVVVVCGGNSPIEELNL